MSNRLALCFPADNTVFSYEITVRINDLNYGGHLSNDAVLRFLHEARVKFLHSLGGSEMNIHGAGIILADVQLVFKAESFYDDLLHIDISVKDFGKYDCIFYYQIIRASDQKRICIAKIRTVFFDYVKRKIRPIPTVFIEQIKALIIK
jgi:YbgC/YbaW family acyl-CoA thioester hydrolase